MRKLFLTLFIIFTANYAYANTYFEQTDTLKLSITDTIETIIKIQTEDKYQEINFEIRMFLSDDKTIGSSFIIYTEGEENLACKSTTDTLTCGFKTKAITPLCLFDGNGDETNGDKCGLFPLVDVEVDFHLNLYPKGDIDEALKGKMILIYKGKKSSFEFDYVEDYERTIEY